jgi:hypothetical protein
MHRSGHLLRRTEELDAHVATIPGRLDERQIASYVAKIREEI